MRCIYMGNEILAVGFRLAGAQIHFVGKDPESAVRNAVEQCDVLILGVSAAKMIGADNLNQLYQKLIPLLVVLPDDGPADDIDIASIRQHLGMSSTGAKA